MKNPIERIKIAFNTWFWGKRLNRANRKAGEGGVICWAYLNVFWELEHGTTKEAQNQLNEFIKFVREREQKANRAKFRIGQKVFIKEHQGRKNLPGTVREHHRKNGREWYNIDHELGGSSEHEDNLTKY